MKYYPYEEFKNDTNLLVDKIAPFNPDAIVAIARGGLTLAHAISQGLDIRKVETLRTELYDGDQKREVISIEGECVLENCARVIVVDDIADSGETLYAVMQELQKRFPLISFESATLFYKKTASIEPNYWIKEADEWIDFFWERDFLTLVNA